jgi:hypothetical protein
MKTLGLLLVVGALGYAYVMSNPAILDQVLPRPPKQSAQKEEKKEDAPVEEEAQSGDHLFPADLTS